MTLRRASGLLWCLLAVGGAPVLAGAQVADLGSRAQGMAGAFVAVADDASAVYWNPAGLGGALVVGAVFDESRQRVEPGQTPETSVEGAEAFRSDGRLFAAALPPLGLSYYRVRHSGVQAGTAEVPPDGREVEGRRVSFRTLETRQFGVTLLQALADGVVVGTTVRLVSGGVSRAEARRSAAWPELADEAASLDAGGERHVDLDAGLMVNSGSVRLGLVVHNLRQPAFSFPDGGGGVTLPRHARVGVAYGAGWPGSARLVVAVDADLTRATALGPDRRDVAAGVEGWGFDRRIGVRGGVRVSTVDGARPVGTAGVSLGVTSALYVDAHVARGGDGAGRAWSVSGRIVY